MLAGPNGSGKSTIHGELKPRWIGTFVNADEIESELARSGSLGLEWRGLDPSRIDLLPMLQRSVLASAFAQRLGLTDRVPTMQIDARGHLHIAGPVDSYLASVLSDAIRRTLLACGSTFTFETVMSSRDKLEFMSEARAAGYRVYLYFVATDDPAINVDRVRRRVLQGGHPVPEIKIRERYVRSLDLLADAAAVAHRVYVFDNSGTRHRLLAEVTDGERMTLATATLPRWFTQTSLWQSFQPRGGVAAAGR